MTLLKNNTVKRGLFACGKVNESNTKKLHSVTLTSDILNMITNKSLLPPGQSLVKIEDFIEVEAKEFVKRLKKLTNLGLDE